MKASAHYGPEPLKLEAFDTITAINTTIANVVSKEFDGKSKLALTLGDDDYSLVLNATNYRVIRARYGDETDDWLDKPIVVYRGMLRYNGGEQPGVCVRIPEPQDEPDVAGALALAGDAPVDDGPVDEFKEDIPF